MITNSLPLKQLLLSAIVPLSMVILFVSIGINFLVYDKDATAEKFKKSPVETLSMTLFALGMYGFIVQKIGSYQTKGLAVILIYLGLILFPLACLFNIIGRFYLGSNWSNQVRLKIDHTLIKKGPYSIVRHPLYASTIWMIYAAGLIYSNYLVLILNSLVFIPFMTFRAHQEELFLISKFPDYKNYIRTTGLFFPKLWRSHETN